MMMFRSMGPNGDENSSYLPNIFQTRRSLSDSKSEDHFGAEFDALSGVGMLLMLVPFIVWYFCAQKQYSKFLKNSTLRMQTISCRLSMFLPAYTLWVWLGVISPDVGILMELPIAITEAMSFWGFFALLVEYFDGPDNVLTLLANSYHSPCFCCQDNHAAFYRRLHRALQYVLWIRSPIAFILLIFKLLENQVAIILLTVIQLGLLANAFVSLVVFFYSVEDMTKSIGALAKIILLKASVVLIVAQGIIVQIVTMSKDSKLTDDEVFTAQDKTYRIYYFIVLIEFCIVSIFFYYAYGSEMIPSSATIDRYTRMEKDPNQRPDISFEDFMYQSCIRVDDVFYHLRPKEGPSDSVSLGQKNASTSNPIYAQGKHTL